MEVEAISIGSPNKLLIQLHGGGMDYNMWSVAMDMPASKGSSQTENWYADFKDIKLVSPTSYREGHTWYESIKNGCGLDDACSYVESTIQDSASRVAALIDHEM